MDCVYKMKTIDLSKQQELDADPKANQQNHFAGNLDRVGDTNIFQDWTSKGKIFGFFTRSRESFVNLFCVNINWWNIIL